MTITTQQMYLHEMSRSSKSSTVGAWTAPSARVVLMYVSDYQMSLGSSSLSYTGSSNKATLKTGWMHQSNNDTTKSTHEWILSRHGRRSNGNYYAWHVHSNSNVSYDYVYDTRDVRPVFYLTDDVKYNSGLVTYDDPYIINEIST